MVAGGASADDVPRGARRGDAVVVTGLVAARVVGVVVGVVVLAVVGAALGSVRGVVVGVLVVDAVAVGVLVVVGAGLVGVVLVLVVDAVVIGVGDQPGLDAGMVRRVIDRWRESGRPIVSASYRGQRGHPVLFAREVFPELLRLEGDAGARLLIEQSAERVEYVEMGCEMPADVDTVEQLKRLLSSS